MDPRLCYSLRELHFLPQDPRRLGCGWPCPRTCRREGLVIAITFTYYPSELRNAEYPDYSGELLLTGIKRGKKGVG